MAYLGFSILVSLGLLCEWQLVFETCYCFIYPTGTSVSDFKPVSHTKNIPSFSIIYTSTNQKKFSDTVLSSLNSPSHIFHVLVTRTLTKLLMLLCLQDFYDWLGWLWQDILQNVFWSIVFLHLTYRLPYSSYSSLGCDLYF